MDLIDRKEVLQHKFLADNGEGWEGWVVEVKDINRIPSQNQWIPCIKDLPKFNEEVIVQGGNSLDNEMFIAELVKNSSTIKEHYGVNSELVWYSQGSFYEFNDVVAWQPLPEPYIS